MLPQNRHRKLPRDSPKRCSDLELYSLRSYVATMCCWTLCEEEAILEEWVFHCFQANVLGKVVGDEDVDNLLLERMVKMGLWCIQYEPSLRPSMKTVLLMLEGIVDIPLPPNPTSFSSVL
ncbi:hypothetical protein Patl1_27812 [Pistacia atlantica]|uniref:Uncharacterized protein n=1 Tax=Pistacia atlantica TaxID=434234 RepID=A0ACC1BC38_9ROSI|nr:hypothetical protein Patl1_27812 [Pistacia atlantica]